MRSPALIFFIALITFVNCRQVVIKNAESTQNLDSKRQPLISPVDDVSWDEYKRIKRQKDGDDSTMTAVKRFQDFLINSKGQCATKMGFRPNEIEKPLLFEDNPTQKEKCLMACVLEQSKIMNADNKVSVDMIGNLAGMISNKNELIIAIARANAENCNRFINTSDKCEAGFQINRCIAHGLKKHKIQIVY